MLNRSVRDRSASRHFGILFLSVGTVCTWGVFLLVFRISPLPGQGKEKKQKRAVFTTSLREVFWRIIRDDNSTVGISVMNALNRRAHVDAQAWFRYICMWPVDNTACVGFLNERNPRTKWPFLAVQVWCCLGSSGGQWQLLSRVC